MIMLLKTENLLVASMKCTLSLKTPDIKANSQTRLQETPVLF
jgi:hypothetical protein